MKSISLAVLGILALSASAFAEEAITVRAKVIGSESKLDIDEVGVSGINFEEGKSEGLQAFGGGADIEFNIAEPLRLGVGLGYTNYDADKDERAYSDLIANVYGSFDFLRADVFSLYGVAGLSYHNLQLAKREVGIGESEYDPTSLLNYDLGVGSRFKLNRELNFGFEYRFSNTFSRNDIDASYSGFGLTADNAGELRDVGITNNELVASLGYSF